MNNSQNARIQTYDRLFVVEKVIGKKIVKGRHFYKVKWKNYSEDQCTWEPIEHFNKDSIGFVNDYEKEINRKDKSNKSDDSYSNSNESLSKERDYYSSDDNNKETTKNDESQEFELQLDNEVDDSNAHSTANSNRERKRRRKHKISKSKKFTKAVKKLIEKIDLINDDNSISDDISSDQYDKDKKLLRKRKRTLNSTSSSNYEKGETESSFTLNSIDKKALHAYPESGDENLCRKCRIKVKKHQKKIKIKRSNSEGKIIF